MSDNIVWLGLSVLITSQDSQSRKDGFSGAYAGVACKAETVADAVKLIAAEFLENGYVLIGFESFLPVYALDREMTDYEEMLVVATSSYPVQFKNVHLHKADS